MKPKLKLNYKRFYKTSTSTTQRIVVGLAYLEKKSIIDIGILMFYGIFQKVISEVTGARKNFELRVGKISNAKVDFVSNPCRWKSFEYQSVSDLFRIF